MVAGLSGKLTMKGVLAQVDERMAAAGTKYYLPPRPKAWELPRELLEEGQAVVDKFKQTVLDGPGHFVGKPGRDSLRVLLKRLKRGGLRLADLGTSPRELYDFIRDNTRLIRSR